MQKVRYRLPGKWRNILPASILLLVVLADQLTKAWIRANVELGRVLFDAGIFQIVHVHNTGAAWGIFKNSSSILLIVDIIGIVIILFIVVFLRRRWPVLDNMWFVSSLSLILAGTVGNMVDRIRFGGVTDFIDIKIIPVFNIADSAVTVGSIILAVFIIFMARESGTRDERKA